MFSVFLQVMEEKEAILEVWGLKDKIGKKLEVLNICASISCIEIEITIPRLNRICDRAHTGFDRAHLCAGRKFRCGQDSFFIPN
jgi:hypothetical protein